MSEAILVFQSQLSGVMETVFKAAMYEIVRLVEDSFLEEVSRSRQQVESLKKRLQWSESRRKEREADGRSRCADCGRAGVCSEDRAIETEPGSEEGHSLKQENVLEGNWSGCPRDTVDPVPCTETEESAAVSPTKAPESIDLEGDKLDVLKEETLQMTHGGNKPLGRWTMCQEAEDVDDPVSDENFGAQKLQHCEAEWGSSARRSLQAAVGGVVEELAEQFKPSYVAEELSGLEEALNTEPKATYNSQILDAGGLSSQHLEDSLQLNYGGPGLMSADLDVLHVADRSAHPLSQRLRRTGFSERLGGSCSGSPCGDVDVRELNYLLINEDGYLQDSDGRYWGQGGAESGSGEAPGGKRFHSEDPAQAQKTSEDHSVSMSGTQGGGGGGGVRRYSCTQCQMTLPDLSSLKVHMRTHKVGPAYTCTQCGKSFTQACNLKVHQRVHSGEGLHLCSHCGKGFISFTDLKRHKCSHTGDKPYCCTLCGNKFSRLWNLKLHRRIHTQEKPHQCTQCDKSFSRADILKVHQRTHTGERPYCCTVCGLSFKRLDHLKSHQRKHRPQ